MTTPTSDPPPSPPLAPLLHARLETAHLCPETGLLVLTFYIGRKLLLGAGLGPHVTGLGFLPRLPRARASSAHPLVAAMRAHLVDHRVRSILLQDGALHLTFDPPDDALPGARLSLRVGRRGQAAVASPSGATVVWPLDLEGAVPRDGVDPSRWTGSAEDLERHGLAMVEASDARALDLLRTGLLRAAKAQLKALERRAEAVRQDLARLQDAPRLQKIGRLLVAQGNKIPKGATKATLDDWEEGGTIEVTLAPDKPAKIQAETFFQKARRLQRGAAVMEKRLAETERAWETVFPLVDAIAAAPADSAALDALAEQAKRAGVSASEVDAASRGKALRQQDRERRPYHAFRDALGRTILVGRGGKDNDELITRHARPHDLWLHAKNIHGAHVIVPLDKGQSCPAELLVDAATLAAHFSDARGENACEVSYVERRHVRKPRKSAPGAVTFDREKILAVRVEPERLARLLATKQEG
ncbi:NFACT RNA binding domain-containing protein [Polyangium sp. 6x1]|uniref:NFACT RNA binding domain-containing protein n=1 Tax=Polyangium sp. 6x1 TaxID=3042689 RepID=UPI0024821272|nr:NFACT RNA binding domain-containing protein [Polyangium sp. 6x1]MDI1444361.1 NFACT RNA binding domain-containing protein [Polyangium sp. 6x1]